jgi:hypothetical protein
MEWTVDTLYELDIYSLPKLQYQSNQIRNRAASHVFLFPRLTESVIESVHATVIFKAHCMASSASIHPLGHCPPLVCLSRLEKD